METIRSIKKIDLVPCRVFQSIVEIMGCNENKINEKNINVFAYLISVIIHLCGKEKRSWRMVWHYINNLENFSQKNYIKLCNFCIVLASFYFWQKNSKYTTIPIIKKTIIFLNKVLSHSFETHFLWIKLYALIALEKHILGKFDCFTVDEIDDNLTGTINFVNQWKDFKTEIYTNALEQQLCMAAYSFFSNCKHLFNKKNTKTEKDFFSETTEKKSLFQMNKKDKTMFLKLSSSNLTIRNDHYYVRSIRSCFNITTPLYFEIKILTSGRITIGVASKNMDIDQEVGSNKFSIGFDGFNKIVKFNGKSYEFSNHNLKWEVNDVIGIYFDFRQLTTIFLLNNNIIKFKNDFLKNIEFFKEESIHVAVSLFQFQQCRFVFDCSIPQKLLNKITQNLPVAIMNSKFINSLILVNSFCTLENFNAKNITNMFNRSLNCKHCEKLTHVKKNCSQCSKKFIFCRVCDKKVTKCVKCKSKIIKN